MLVFQIKVTYQGETHKGAHECNSVADLRIKNGSFARFAQVFFFLSSSCFVFFRFVFAFFVFVVASFFTFRNRS